MMSISYSLISAPLRLLVAAIIQIRADPKVINANARRIVAPMKDKFVYRRGTIGESPRDPIAKQKTTRELETSITFRKVASSPYPASAKTSVMQDTLIGQRTVLVDLGPKPFLVLGREISER